MRRRTLPIALLVLALVTAACGGDEKSSAPKGSSSRATTEATLRAALLTQDEVPSGFKRQATTEEDEDGGAGSGCLEQDTADVVPPAANASVEFASDNAAQQISHEVEAYSAGRAEEAMAEARRAAERCKTFEEVVEGATTRGSLTEVPAPPFGDDSLSFTVTATVEAITLNAEVVAVRKDATISIVTMVNTNAPVDRAAFDGVVAAAFAKMPGGLG